MTDNQRLVEVLDVLYGDGAYEISKKLSDEQKKEIGRKIGYATNAAGMVAGPGAVYMAVKGRKGGGIPRGIAHGIGKPMTRSKHRPVKVAGVRLRRAANALDHPGNDKKLKKLAAGAGVTSVGLQVANWTGDSIAANALKKKPDEIHKSDEMPSDTSPKMVKMKLAQKGVNAAGTAAKSAPSTAQKVSSKFKAIRVGPNKMQAEVAPNPQFPAEVSKSVDFEIKGEVSKMNTDKQQVFGWASIIEMNGEPVIDLQGDVMTIDTIEKAAYQYVHGSRKGGRQHERNGEEPLHVSDMIESFVLTPEKKEKMGLPDDTPTGWWVGFQVNDLDTWQQYKDGRLKEFSIHGSGVRKDLEL